MGVFTNNNYYTNQAATFSSSTTSNAIQLNGYSPMALVTPATFGATSITFKASIDGTTYYTVNDDTGLPITITVSSTAAGWADITNVFPASVGSFIQLVTNTAASGTVQLISRDAQ